MPTLLPIRVSTTQLHRLHRAYPEQRHAAPHGGFLFGRHWAWVCGSIMAGLGSSRSSDQMSSQGNLPSEKLEKSWVIWPECCLLYQVQGALTTTVHETVKACLSVPGSLEPQVAQKHLLGGSVHICQCHTAFCHSGG